MEEHRQFIESTVAANTDCKWKIVTLHQDIYGSAEHSNEPEITNLRYSLVPVFEQNDIDLVLAGHDHAYSRTKMLKGGQFKMEYSDDEFESIMKVARQKQITVLVDEAYHYFYPKTFIKYALTEDHVFITRTFSKLFSMAGCRLGYVVGWSDGVKMVQKMCTPHNTNAFAMMFAEKVLTTPGMLDSLITNFNGGRKYLVNSLDKNGYRHKGEAGNFIFIEPKTDAQTIVDRMKAEKKILIKAYPNVGEFGNCLRVSIGEEKYMKQFVEALLEIDR